MSSDEAAGSADPCALAGTVLAHKYRVSRLVAEGGFGFVYFGHHLVLDVPIAIKVLKPDLVRATAGGSDFVREAQLVARLKHPAIVRVLDAGKSERSATGEGGTSAWMILEWLQGQTLKASLAELRGTPGATPRDAWRVLEPVFSALQHAHAHGVVHRDLKPSNIMLVASDAGPSARVLDFGIAKAVAGDGPPETGETRTGGGEHAFSRNYAAPEQLSGARTGPWTDVHALGLLLVELLAHRSPYPTRDATELYRAVFADERPSPARYGIDVGPWQPILERAVALKPSLRFVSVRDFANALQATVEEATAAVLRQRALGHGSGGSQRHEPPLPNVLEGGDTLSVLSTGAPPEKRPAGAHGRTLAAVVAVSVVVGLALTLRASRAPLPAPAVASAPLAAPSASVLVVARPTPATVKAPALAASLEQPAALPSAARKGQPRTRPTASAAVTEKSAPAASSPALPPYELE